MTLFKNLREVFPLNSCTFIKAKITTTIFTIES